MSFKDKHPGLKKNKYSFEGCCLFERVGDDDWDCVEDGDMILYTQEEIDATQIDKEVLRKALMRMFQAYDYDENGKIQLVTWEEFKKHLNGKSNIETLFPYKQEQFRDLVEEIDL
jgi:Ca2+-binding EF-hand superfamily protein